MMVANRAPGAYFQRVEPRGGRFELLRADIAGFVGIAARGPLHEAVRVSGRKQFEAQFGRPIPQAFLAPAVAGFFENGGRDCYVVRVAHPADAAPATVRVYDEDLPLFNLEATSPGVWGRAIRVLARRAGRGAANLFIQLRDGSRAVEIRRAVPLSDDLDAVNAALASALLRAVALSFAGAAELRLPANAELVYADLLGGDDGLARLTVGHFTGDAAPPGELWGLNVLEQVDEVSILAMPDCVLVPRAAPRRRPSRPPDCCAPLDELTVAETIDLDAEREYPPLLSADDVLRVHQALIGQCERLTDRVALLDPYRPDMTPDDILAWRQQPVYTSSYAALYYPWLRMLTWQGNMRDVPPSGSVAGIYARLPVHQAPANQVVEYIQDVTVAVDEVRHGLLNEARVNVIRAAPTRGLRLMGARTLSDNTLWRFVNVRRLFIYIRESIEVNTAWMPFEPNDPRLWLDIGRVMRAFLGELWQRGMLDGATREDAYEIKCDAEINPPAEIDRGRVLCLIGVQPPFPAEFVRVYFGKTVSGVEFVEALPNG